MLYPRYAVRKNASFGHAIAAAQPVAHSVFRLRVRQVAGRLQDQHLEHQHWIIRRTVALRPVRPLQRRLQSISKRLEVHWQRQPLKRIAGGAQALIVMLAVKNRG